MTPNSIFYIIVDRGKANTLLHRALECGAKGGTILLGEGTVPPGLLVRLLGLNEVHKELLMVGVPAGVDQKLISMLKQEFNLHKRNKGIAFSMPFVRYEPEAPIGCMPEIHEAPYTCIMTVLDRGQGHPCMDLARKAGAQGGTILHGHGAGVPQNFYFPLMIEPQKDLLLIVTPTNRAEAIKQAIYEGMELGRPGSGILFAMPVMETVGLYEGRQTGGGEAK